MAYVKRHFVNLHINKSNNIEPITVVKKDTYSNFLYVNLFENDFKFNLTDVETIEFEFTKKNNNKFSSLAKIIDVENGKIRCLIDKQCISQVGTVLFEIKIKYADGSVITLDELPIEVTRDTITTSPIDVTELSDYISITDIIEEINTKNLESYSKEELDDGVLDFRYANKTELDEGYLNTRYYTKEEIYNSIIESQNLQPTDVIEVEENKKMTNEHNGNFIKCINDENINIRIDNDLYINIPIGSKIDLFKYGEGDVSIIPQLGVTLNSTNAKRTIDGKYNYVTLLKVGSNEWLLYGNLKHTMLGTTHKKFFNDEVDNNINSLVDYPEEKYTLTNSFIVYDVAVLDDGRIAMMYTLRDLMEPHIFEFELRVLIGENTEEEFIVYDDVLIAEQDEEVSIHSVIYALRHLSGNNCSICYFESREDPVTKEHIREFVFKIISFSDEVTIVGANYGNYFSSGFPNDFYWMEMGCLKINHEGSEYFLLEFLFPSDSEEHKRFLISNDGTSITLHYSDSLSFLIPQSPHTPTKYEKYFLSNRINFSTGESELVLSEFDFDEMEFNTIETIEMPPGGPESETYMVSSFLKDDGLMVFLVVGDDEIEQIIFVKIKEDLTFEKTTRYLDDFAENSPFMFLSSCVDINKISENTLAITYIQTNYDYDYWYNYVDSDHFRTVTQIVNYDEDFNLDFLEKPIPISKTWLMGNFAFFSINQTEGQLLLIGRAHYWDRNMMINLKQGVNKYINEENIDFSNI